MDAQLEEDVDVLVINHDSAGVRMTPEEFDALEEGQYEEGYRYELVNGVLVVNAIPLEQHAEPNEVLGYWLRRYQEEHPQGRCVDATLPDPADAYRIIRGELEAYGAGLEDKPEIVALSKADALPEAELKKKAKSLAKAAGRKPLMLSAVSGQGMTEALRELAAVIAAARTKRRAPEPRAAGWQP